MPVSWAGMQRAAARSSNTACRRCICHKVPAHARPGKVDGMSGRKKDGGDLAAKAPNHTGRRGRDRQDLSLRINACAAASTRLARVSSTRAYCRRRAANCRLAGANGLPRRPPQPTPTMPLLTKAVELLLHMLRPEMLSPIPGRPGIMSTASTTLDLPHWPRRDHAMQQPMWSAARRAEGARKAETRSTLASPRRRPNQHRRNRLCPCGLPQRRPRPSPASVRSGKFGWPKSSR